MRQRFVQVGNRHGTSQSLVAAKLPHYPLRPALCARDFRCDAVLNDGAIPREHTVHRPPRVGLSPPLRLQLLAHEVPQSCFHAPRLLPGSVLPFRGGYGMWLLPGRDLRLHVQ